ncbi:1-deoxy-D-xylulose-5-phosphate synthase [Spirochaetia bacterium]|nr:1-deoxy-D-xylulose-5-phosphate synthase [Spirochaetia bacterium]
MFSLLENIRHPHDLKSLDHSQLITLAQEIRGKIVETVSKNGGHLSSNLGTVELTLALHRVFDTPKDKIVWDVGHQCYAHKLLTGRFGQFSTLRQKGGIAGFPKISESPHDAFNTGHASTSVSIALGLLVGEIMHGGDGKCIAVIGDGAITGGLAYEALSHAGQLRLPLIVILNDNKMSIGKSVGGISEYLSRLSMKAKYQYFRRSFDQLVQKIPVVGAFFFKLVVRLKRAVKAVFYNDNLFVDLGFEYAGPIEGHNLQALEKVLRDVKNLDRPVVVHVVTQKGKGYEPAEKAPGVFHSTNSFLAESGEIKPPVPSWTSAFGSAVLEAAKKDKRIVALTAAMEKGTGLSQFREAFPDRFFDVGIAEEHCVSFAAALAASGMKPVAAIYSTFVQRSVDQLIHDTALQNLNVVFAVDRAGFVSGDGETHQGLFDLSLFRTIPNMTILCPASETELNLMLAWAFACEGPCMIRYPKAPLPPDNAAFPIPLIEGRGVFVKQSGGKICIAFTGSLYEQAFEAVNILEKKGINADLYNLRFIKPLDEDHLALIMNSYEKIFFVEEGIKNGGIGEAAAELALRKKCPASVVTLNAGDKFYAHASRAELLAEAGLDGQGIAAAVSGTSTKN